MRKETSVLIAKIMKIEIDQSGKIENTNKNTIIAFSNGKFKSVFISAKEKREIQKFFRRIGKPNIFIYKVFAVLVFLLIKSDLKVVDNIIIDEEYPGKSSLIKNLLLQEIRRIKPDFDRENIIFQRIGKKSRAHFLAYGVAVGKKKADIEVGAREILRMVVK